MSLLEPGSILFPHLDDAFLLELFPAVGKVDACLSARVRNGLDIYLTGTANFHFCLS